MGWPFRRKKDMPADMWMVCPSCGEYVYRKQVTENFDCCPLCAHHLPVSARRRIELTADPGTVDEFAQDVISRDVLEFHDAKGGYGDKLVKYRKKTGQGDACLVARCRIQGVRAVVAALDFTFLGGSMGHAVGEKVAIAFEAALEDDLPIVVFSASGGARMQEGALSLMQMGKTSATVHRFKDRGNKPYISVLTYPTTGGVTASFSALGDVTLAEPKSLIGFAGPNVIKQTIKADLPSGFQSSEFNLEHGFIDRIIDRQDLRETLIRLLTYLCPQPNS